MRDLKGYIFDLDGTVYLGKQLIEGADIVINSLLDHGKKVLFLTNKTIESRQRYVEKLRSFNINASLENILNPTVTLIDYLREHHPDATLYVIGEQPIKDELTLAGFREGMAPSEVDVVVLSWDRDFHYDHLNFAYQAVKLGAKMIATNPDRTCPVEVGDVPDCAGMIGAVEAVAGKKIDVQIGKPSVLTIEAALKILQLKPDECVMIGDRLETDIRMGIEAGMKTALVLSGITTEDDLRSSAWKPDYVLPSVSGLLAAKRAGG
ncbi:HAD-IIA family hydrolase [Bacillus sp. ISL-35]|uniref:HAD-IIA family hydrolase n=1 Tax=Bacillus sp. ISL-35 TaxID=2819122 RepID=UPI001BEA33DB|nr:HAD-IIA family hydrolase [Bacillus sp. ISL-35]MBT2678712.1 HAD-IIA family hydrolase [Bacillus sp. ISL-35]MBT2703704.1 HAD-IIA family hydrolase [Chryseobacterium sp. ISL-80]